MFKASDDFLSECVEITGAVIDGDYRDYSNGGGFFSAEGSIIDGGDQHPLFDLSLDEVIQLEFHGKLEKEQTVDEYIKYLGSFVPHFGHN